MKLLRNLQRTLRLRGVDVRKAPAVDYSSVPFFHMACELLAHRAGRPLTFVQVGANDGFQFGDPIHDHVVKDGWRGILIEPQPHMFALLLETYKDYADRLTFENIAISPDQKELTLYQPPGEFAQEAWAASGASAVSSRMSSAWGDKLSTIKVPALTLDALLQKHAMETFDVLQIDVEGYDWEVLRSLTLSQYRPSIVQFEHGHMSREHCTSIVRYLGQNGYRIYWGGRENDSLALHAEAFGLS